MIHRQKKRRTWAVYFVGLLAFFQLLSIALPGARVYADTMDDYTSATRYARSGKLAEQVFDHQMYYFLTGCFAQVDIDKTPANEVKDWRWLEDFGESRENGVRGAMYDNVTGDCSGSKDIGEAFKTLGFTDPVKTFCSLDFTYNNFNGGNGKTINGGDSTEDCIAGVNAGKDSDGSGSKSDQVKALEKLLQTTTAGKAASGSLSEAAEYIRYLESLVNGCEIGLLEKYDNTANYPDSVYKIPIVSADGTITNWRGVALNSNGADVDKGDKQFFVGTTTSDFLEKSCGELEKRLPELALAYQKYLRSSEGKAELAGGGVAGGGTALEEDNAREDTCETNNGDSGWFGCSLIIKPLDGIISFLDKQIRNLLTVKTTELNNGGALKESWAIMRNIAYLVLIPMMLFMVIGTALEFGPFDAYTVKKALPRMLAAIVFMSISYYLCIFFIEMSNVVGVGILNLISLTAPGGNVTQLADIFSAGEGSFVGLASGTSFVALGLAGSITWGIVGSFMLVTVIALLMGYVTLVLRQVLIVMLIVLSPLAILIWIFPGNDKLWTVWKTTFIAMLMMFPIVMILIASGRFFAGTADQLYDGATGTFIKLIAYIAPYFFIPAAFKAGMGAFGVVTGAMSDRSRGFFDKQRKFREGNREKYRQRAREGNRFAGGVDGKNFRGRLNRGISGTMNAPSAVMDSGNTFKPQNWRGATRQAMQNAKTIEAERNMKENTTYQSWMHDDGLNKAASKTSNAKELREYLVNNAGYARGSRELDDAVNRVETVRRGMSTEAFKGMTARQALAGGTAYKSSTEPGAAKTAAGEAWADVARASVNDDAMASYLVANGRSEGMKAGRLDYAGAGFGTTLGVVNKMRKEYKETGDISQATIEAATREINADAFAGQGGASIVHSSMKPDSIKEMVPTLVNDLETARTIRTGDPAKDARQFSQSLASLAAVYDGLQGSSPAKAQVIADGVMNQEIDVATLAPEMRAKLQSVIQPTRIEESQVHEMQPDGKGGTMGVTKVVKTPVPAGPARTKITYQQAIDGMRGDGEFKQMRREYASEVDAMMGQQPPEPGSTPGALG